MSGLLGAGAYALAVVALVTGFLIQGAWLLALVTLALGGLWVWASVVYLKRWLLSAGLVLTVLAAVLAVAFQTPTLGVLLALALGLVGDALLRFELRYRGVEVVEGVARAHALRAATVGAAALAVGGLAFAFQASLAFWPVLGLGVLTLVALIAVARRLRSSIEDSP